ncbi:hypothetical protein [Paenibacillus faecalis]|nr:hypothetical protein [Paenibacillus faecalis]
MIIKDRFGEIAILPASSFLDAGQAMENYKTLDGQISFNPGQGIFL